MPSTRTGIRTRIPDLGGPCPVRWAIRVGCPVTARCPRTLHARDDRDLLSRETALDETRYLIVDTARALPLSLRQESNLRPVAYNATAQPT